MTRAYLILTLLLVAQVAQGDDDSELKSFVFNALAKYQIAHDDLTKAGYACMAVGLNKEPPSNARNKDGVITPTLNLTCRRGDVTTYVASYKTHTRTFGGDAKNGDSLPVVRSLTKWQFEVFSGKRVKVSRSEISPPQEMTRLKFTKSRSSTVKKHDPFQDWLSPSLIDSCRLPQDVINIFATEMQLMSVRDTGSGLIEAVFEMQYPQLLNRYKVVFSKAHGDMPIDVQITVVEPKSMSDSYICHGKYSWVKQSDLWLPRQIEYGHTIYFGREHQFFESEFYLTWKIGSEVPAECFKFDNVDPKKPLAELFGFDYDVYDGKRVVKVSENEWVLPEELAQSLDTSHVP